MRWNTAHGMTTPVHAWLWTFLRLFPLSSLSISCCKRHAHLYAPLHYKRDPGASGISIGKQTPTSEHTGKQSSLELSHTTHRDLGLDLPLSTLLVTRTTSIQAQITLSHRHWT